MFGKLTSNKKLNKILILKFEQRSTLNKQKKTKNKKEKNYA